MKTRLWALAILVPVLLSCSNSDPAAPDNTAPTLTWTFTPIAVGTRWDVVLTVSVRDPDENADLTTTWTVTRGTLAAQGKFDTQLGWRTPTTVGTDTVVVTVSDGTDTDRVEAEIIVGTGVVGSTLPVVMTRSSSPYVIKPSGDVASVFATSTINEGVVMYIDTPGSSIQVEGLLTANGTAANPVVIRANDRTVNCVTGVGWWEGVRAQGGAGRLALTHTRIWNANKAVSLPVGNSGAARLVACELGCSNIGAEISSAGWLVVDSCLVNSNAEIGVYVKSGSQKPDSVAIRDSQISLNGSTAIQIDAPGFNTPLSIQRCRLERNSTFGIHLVGESKPIIEYNHFDGNGPFRNIYMDLGYPGDMAPPAPSPTLPWLAADNNYWGFVPPDSLTIRATIRDREDEPASIGTYLYVTPWLDTSPLP